MFGIFNKKMDFNLAKKLLSDTFLAGVLAAVSAPLLTGSGNLGIPFTREKKQQHAVFSSIHWLSIH